MSNWKKTPRWNRPNVDDRGMMSIGGMDYYDRDSGNYDDGISAKRLRQQINDSEDIYGSRNVQQSSFSMLDTDPFRDMREPSSSSTFDDPFRDMRLPSSSGIFDRDRFMSHGAQDSDLRQQDVMNRQTSVGDQGYNEQRAGGMSLDSDYHNEFGRSLQDNFSAQRGSRSFHPLRDNLRNRGNYDDDDGEEEDDGDRFQEFSSFKTPMNEYRAEMQQSWGMESQPTPLMQNQQFFNSNAMALQQNRMIQRALNPQQEQVLNQMNAKKQKRKRMNVRGESGPFGMGMLSNPGSGLSSNWNSQNAGGFQRNWMNTGGQSNFGMQQAAQSNQGLAFHQNMSGRPMPLMSSLNIEHPSSKFEGKELTRTIPNNIQAQRNPMNLNSKGPFFCNVCNLTFSPHSQLLTHLNSSAHKFKLRLLKSLSTPKPKKNSSESKAVAEKPKQVSKGVESTAPNYCSLCKKKFKGTMIEHKQSKDHKANKAYARPFCALCKQFLRTPGRFVKHCKSEYHQLQRSRLAAAEKEKAEAAKAAESGSKSGDAAKAVESGSKSSDAVQAKENGKGKKTRKGGQKVKSKEQSAEFVTVDAVGIYEDSGDHQVITLDDSDEKNEKGDGVKKSAKKRKRGNVARVAKGVPKESNPENEEQALSDQAPVGETFVTPGFYCFLCSEFFEDETFAKTVHCKSGEHVSNYKSKFSKEAEDKDAIGGDNEPMNDEIPTKADEKESDGIETVLSPKQVNNEASETAENEKQMSEENKEPTTETVEEAEPSSTSNQENDKGESNTEESVQDVKKSSNDSSGTEGGQVKSSDPAPNDDDSCEVCFENISAVVIKKEDS